MTYEPIPNQPTSTPQYQSPSAPWTPTAPSSNGYTPVGYTTAAPTNVLSIWSLALGIVGALFVWILAPIGAIVTGHMSLKQIAATGDAGKGMALAGLILGYVSLLLQIAGIVFFFLVVGWAAAEAAMYSTY